MLWFAFVLLSLYKDVLLPIKWVLIVIQLCLLSSIRFPPQYPTTDSNTGFLVVTGKMKLDIIIQILGPQICQY